MHLEGFKDSPYCCKRVNKICKCCKCSSGEDATRMSSTKSEHKWKISQDFIYESLKCSSGIAKDQTASECFQITQKGVMIALLCTSSGLIEFDDMPSRDQCENKFLYRED
ncbi:hypothetical protein TNCV_4307631 [Trichonephila clavipes]|nr:hypothetical protein TNCV_4307631 [Trichonephila clavipes]